jgi:preprotein translocase subunit SecE
MTSLSISKGIRFVREVRNEASRITWPSLADTRMMTLLVFVLVVLIAGYLMLVDFALGSAINWMLAM